MTLLKALINQYIGPQFSSIQKAQNVCVVLFAIIWGINLIGTLLTLFFFDNTTADYIRKFPIYLLILALPYGLWRAHNEIIISHTTTSYLLLVSGFANSINALIVPPNRPVDQYALCFMVCLTAMRPEQWKLQLITSFPGLFISWYKNSFGVYPGYPTWQIMDPERRLTVDVVANLQMIVFLPLVLMTVRVHSQSYYDSLRALQGTVMMTKEVSENLAEYNTTGAEETLAKYSQIEDCDQKLQVVLSTIVENMKKYKPFLPNYVITSEFDEESEDSTQESQDRRRGSSGSIDVEIIPTERSSSPHSPDRKRSSVVLLPPRPRSGQSKSKHKNNENSLTSLQQLTMIPVQREVCYGMIHFAYKNDDVIDNPLPLRNFIEKVYSYANASSGAVHSCICDTVHMTWNATTICQNAKQRATAGLRMLSAKSQVTLSSRTEVHGSIMSCMSECRMVGKLHQTFLIHFSAVDGLVELYRYACKVKTNVVCKSVANDIRETVMLVDVLPYPTPTEMETPRFVEVYEISTGDINKKYGVLMTRAVQAFTSKNYEEVVAMLTPSIEIGPASLRALHRKAEEYLEMETTKNHSK